MAIHSSTLAWKIPRQRSLVGCSPWGLEESDTTKRLHFHFSLSCTGEGNGNPLYCSCLGSLDGGAWWAAIYGVAQSRTRLKWLSSSSSHTLKRFGVIKLCHSFQTFFCFGNLWIFFKILLFILFMLKPITCYFKRINKCFKFLHFNFWYSTYW